VTSIDSVLASGGRIEGRRRAAHRAYLASETELADEDAPARRRGPQSGEPQERDREREVDGDAGLAHGRGREVDGDLSAGLLEAAVLERRADSLAGLAHAGVRQSDERERRDPVGEVDFDIQDAGIDPERRGGVDTDQHGATRELRGDRPARGP
jgi:hypothetical protein